MDDLSKQMRENENHKVSMFLMNAEKLVVLGSALTKSKIVAKVLDLRRN